MRPTDQPGTTVALRKFDVSSGKLDGGLQPQPWSKPQFTTAPGADQASAVVGPHPVLPRGFQMSSTRHELLLAVAITTTALLLAMGVSRAQDAAVVNPRTVHVKFENAEVRVLEAELPPNAREQLHSHPACVIYVITGGKARNHLANGATSEIELTAGQTIYREPTTHWSENIGNSAIHLILVELKSTGSVGPGSRKAAES
jgi:beta-alanine degradation protein BauB